MSLARDSYSGTIPAQADGSTVYFNIYAQDTTTESTTSDTQNYSVAMPVVDTPTFNPVAGTYTETQSVEILCGTADATILYTVDGSEPDLTSNLYASALTIDATTTVKARAYKTNYAPSAVAEAIYTIGAADPANIYISEYIEGSSYNKAIEIYNAGDSEVNLGFVTVGLISGGGEWSEQSMTLSGTLAVGDVYVIAHPSANTGILAVTDITNNTVINYNGDDAIGIFYDGVLVDAVGTNGADPGTAWDVAGIVGATANHTLIRKSTVTTGTTDWATSAGTNATDSQWIVNDIDTYENLGLPTPAEVPVTNPVITNIIYLPTNPTPSDAVVVTADITDDDGIASAYINWGLASDALNNQITMTLTRENYTGTIPAQADGSMVYFNIEANDNATGSTISTVTNYSVSMLVVATPTFSPAAGTYGSAQSVEILCETTDATIMYTIDGSEPDLTSNLYASALTIDATTTVKAKAYKTGYTPSAVAEAVYTISEAAPANIYISEYLEGSSNNKAFEIYNAGDTSVDLGLVEVWRISNEGDWTEGATNSVTLSGTLAPGEVYVICNSSAIAEIQALSELIGTTICYFNGNDAMGLVYNGTLVDAIGLETVTAPSVGWDVAGVTAATANHTILRKAAVTSGNMNWAASAGTNASDSEWIVLDIDNYSNLGQPTSLYNESPVITNILVSPLAPEVGMNVTISADVTDDDTIASVNLFYGDLPDFYGILVPMNSRATYSAVLSGLSAGTYYFVIVATDNEGAVVTSEEQIFTVTEPTPTEGILVSETSLSFTATVGETSDIQEYTLEGVNLVDVINIVVTGPFQVSDNALSWDNELFDLDPEYNGSIWVRYMPTVAGAQTGEITHSSTDYDDVIINLSGTATLPLVDIENENFDLGTLGNWTAVSVIGAQTWLANSSNAYMNGYLSGAQDNEDWLISPAMNFDAYENEVFSFDSAKNYTGPDLEVYISTDYVDNPSTASWTALNPVLSSGSNVWTGSGDLDVSAYSGTVRIAFKYVSTTGGAASWRVDNVLIQGTVIEGVNTAPTIDTIVSSPQYPSSTDTVTVSANITDEDGIASAYINWGFASDALNNDVAMTLSRNTYTGIIPAQVAGATVYYTITATDNNASPLAAVSGVQSYTVVMDVTNIAALRLNSPSPTVYCLAGEAVLTFQQSYRYQKYIQDSTGAILIDDVAGAITTAYNVYDGITGLCGYLTEYGGMLQFVPVADPGIATSTGNTITPAVITLADMTTGFETYEAQVVTVNNVSFSALGNFANGTVYVLSDGTNTYNFRSTFYDVDYIGTAIPSQPVNLTGILNSRTDGEYITARVLTDFDVITTVVATPYFTPAAGTYTETQSVEIFCDTVGASIYYTLDGTDPDDTSSLYSAPLSISATTTVKAIAYLTGLTPSNIAEVVYTIIEPVQANLYISEYIEGSSNNKAIEIYNAGTEAVDLGLAEFWRISNDGDWTEGATNAVTLSGTLNPGEVYVICNSSAIAEIQALSDLIGTTICYFNGNDAMGLVYNGVLIDAIGVETTPATLPSLGWDVAGVITATANHTLVRKATVTAGTMNWAASAGTDADDSEWIVYDIDDYSNLGLPTPTGTPTPDMPTNLVITNDAVGRILTWDVAANAVTYKVYAADNPFALEGDWLLVATVSDTMWTDTETNSKRFYKVIASSDSLPLRSGR
ncbi:MAG: chitobiase/beta-hexosaminidase C-terminal domain-containing protein [Candidatus Cloacimonetes bacterium]|nr:chitobiase/beta-hexosaminidase C-terminal domain-containing protein [Candidatus Cloacimonadota bacterium]